MYKTLRRGLMVICWLVPEVAIAIALQYICCNATCQGCFWRFYFDKVCQIMPMLNFDKRRTIGYSKTLQNLNLNLENNHRRFLMQIHSTNYFNTFIQVAEDCPATAGETPPTKGQNKSIANLQYEMIAENPYQHTSDDVFFSIYATRKGIDKKEKERQNYFSKGQPCFRASPLAKRYGWGIHSNAEGKIALYGVDTEQYKRYVKDGSVKSVKAMRSKRA